MRLRVVISRNYLGLMQQGISMLCWVGLSRPRLSKVGSRACFTIVLLLYTIGASCSAAAGSSMPKVQQQG